MIVLCIEAQIDDAKRFDRPGTQCASREDLGLGWGEGGGGERGLMIPCGKVRPWVQRGFLGCGRGGRLGEVAAGIYPAGGMGGGLGLNLGVVRGDGGRVGGWSIKMAASSAGSGLTVTVAGESEHQTRQ